MRRAAGRRSGRSSNEHSPVALAAGLTGTSAALLAAAAAASAAALAGSALAGAAASEPLAPPDDPSAGAAGPSLALRLRSHAAPARTPAMAKHNQT